jgi:hypothetical protein
MITSGAVSVPHLPHHRRVTLQTRRTARLCRSPGFCPTRPAASNTPRAIRLYRVRFMPRYQPALSCTVLRVVYPEKLDVTLKGHYTPSIMLIIYCIHNGSLDALHHVEHFVVKLRVVDLGYINVFTVRYLISFTKEFVVNEHLLRFERLNV